MTDVVIFYDLFPDIIKNSYLESYLFKIFQTISNIEIFFKSYCKLIWLKSPKDQSRNRYKTPLIDN
jgi:hypothetical protein